MNSATIELIELLKARDMAWEEWERDMIQGLILSHLEHMGLCIEKVLEGLRGKNDE